MSDHKDILDIDSLTQAELQEILTRARLLRDSNREHSLERCSLGLLFEKPSTRTRVSFETGMTQLGGHAVFMSASDLQLDRGEPIADTARALAGYLDVIAARLTDHRTLETLAAHADIPVINALTDEAHPCQTLADLLTIHDHCGDSQDVSVAYVGDGNNVARSLTIGCAMAGIEISLASPPAYQIEDSVIERAREYGVAPKRYEDPISAVAGADIIYTDVWVSMGDDDRSDRLDAFEGYQVNESLLAHAPSSAAVMHCLPAVRGEEITDAVLESDRSLVWTQAENRLYAQQGLLTHLMDGPTGDSPTTAVGSYQGALSEVDLQS